MCRYCYHRNAFALGKSSQEDFNLKKSRSITKKYYSAIKREGALLHTTSWMNLESMLSERNGTQKTIVWFNLYGMFRTDKSRDRK